MNKFLVILIMVGLFLAVSPATLAFASSPDDGGEPSNVTITVVIPDPVPEPEDEPAPEEIPVPEVCEIMTLYPCDVTEIRGDNEWRIIKTYELTAEEKPEFIPRNSFERSGWKFSLTDIIRKETSNVETRDYTQKVTVETATKELEKILPLLSQTVEYRSDDGFVGILTLDIASIKVESAGTKTTSYTMSVTREYPRLTSNDTSFIPKTVEDNGKIYTLAGVEWRSGNNVTVDYESLAEYYTAVATYTATGTSTKVTGYVTTAVYSGTLAKLSEGKPFIPRFLSARKFRRRLKRRLLRIWIRLFTMFL
jgi:hypothetical protein